MLSEELSHILQRISCSDYNGKSFNEFVIVETDAASVIKKVTINNIDRANTVDGIDWFSFDPDRGRNGPVMSTLLTVEETRINDNAVVGEKIVHLYHHKACDHIMVINKSGKLTVLYFELKTGATGFKFQFVSSQCFVRYLVDVCNSIGGKNFEIEKERFIVFHAASALVNKTVSPAQQVKELKQSTPDKPYKVYVNTPAKAFPFNQFYA